MADQTSLANRVAELESQVQRLLGLLGQASASSPEALFLQVDTLHSRVETSQKSVGEWPDIMGQRARAVVEEMSVLTDIIDLRIDGMQADLNVLKRAVGREEDRAHVSKFKVLDPKPFARARSAKELENFLWDMKTYFQATRVPEAEKVSIKSMYLTGDAKLWWRSRLPDDASANREKVETWEVLKKELKEQFLPCNTSWVARESLRNLRHTGTVREFVKEFSSLLLDVRDMSEEGKLFNFMVGLQPWVKIELRRQGVKDLPSAITAADRLADFKDANNPEQRQEDPGKGKAKFGKKFKRKEKAKEVVTGTSEPRAVEKSRGDCFICGNLEHRAMPPKMW
ncbi:UNVERIFIED_CONTAM: hypothetical protein Sradi_5279300 [Sesamum radiatum]|uniref:Retrotransposon gag domain-containing protein n=1 Tax=Sesamum radiatum TaxID=300843 RepID=A0AAW2LMD2_SESRA